MEADCVCNIVRAAVKTVAEYFSEKLAEALSGSVYGRAFLRLERTKIIKLFSDDIPETVKV